MSRTAVLVGLVFVALGGTVIWLASRVHTLEGDVCDLTERLNNPATATQRSESSSDSDHPTLEADTTFEDQVEHALRSGALKRVLQDSQEDAAVVSALTRLLQNSSRPAAAGTTRAGATSPGTPSPDDAVFYGAVKDVVMELTDNVDFRTKLGLNVPPKDIPKNAPFARVADVLKLDQRQSDTMRKDVEDMQGKLMEALTIERSDGVDVMGEIAKAEALKEGDPSKTEIFVKLFQLKIPGTETTYFQRVTALQRDFRNRTLDYLHDEQLERLKSINVDWFSVRMD